MSYFIFLMVIFVGFVSSKYNYIISRYMFFTLSLFLFFISAFRVGVKPDYYNYEYFYNLIDSGYDSYKYGLYGVEKSFLLISDFFSSFEYGFRYTLLFYSAVTLLFIYRSYSKLTPEPILALAVYYSFFFIIRDMGVIRAGLAYAILMFSLVFYVDRKVIKFSIAVLIASLFHQSSVVFFILIPFYFSEFLTERLKLILAFSILFYFSGIAQFVTEYFSSSSGYVGVKFQDYSKESDLNYALGFFDINNIKNVVLSMIGLYVHRKTTPKGIVFNAVLLVFVLGTCVRIIFLDFSSISGRLSSIFMSIEPVYISILVGMLSRRRNRYLGYVLVFIYCVAMLYLGIDKYETFNYRSIMEDLI